MSAAWPPASTALSMASRATSVLPLPTSPWSSRSMRAGCAMSAPISASTRCCARGQAKGRAPSTASRGGRRRRRPPGLAGGALPDQGEGQLVGEQLVEGEALARRPIQRHLVGAHRLVQAPERFPEARPAPTLEQGPILPLRQLGEVLERLPGEPVHDPGAEGPGQRIDRLQGACALELGGGQDQLRMDDLPVAPEAGERAAHDPGRALGQRRLQIARLARKNTSCSRPAAPWQRTR